MAAALNAALLPFAAQGPPRPTPRLFATVLVPSSRHPGRPATRRIRHGGRARLMNLDSTILLLLIPVVVIQLGLLIWALYDLTRPERRVRATARSCGPSSSSSSTGSARSSTSSWAARSPDVTVATRPVVRRPAGDRGLRPDQALRRRRRARPLDLDVPAGSRLRLPRPERRRQDDDAAAPDRPRPGHGGRAEVAGIPVGRDGPTLARRIGYLDQDPRFYGWMTGREILALVGRAYGVAGAALRSRVEEVLETVGLAEAAGRRIGGLLGRHAPAARHRPGDARPARRSCSSTSPSARSTRRAGATSSSSSAACGARRPSSCAPTSSPTSSGSATASRSSTTAGSSPRRRSTSSSTATPARSSSSTRSRARTPRSRGSRRRSATAPWTRDVVIAHGLLRVFVTDAEGAAAETLPLVVAAGRPARPLRARPADPRGRVPGARRPALIRGEAAA